jgi:hypothetical protein
MQAIGTRAELRAAVTRGFYEQQRAKLAARAPRVILPRQLAPMEKARVAQVFSPEIDEPATNAARSAAFAGLGHRREHSLIPALLGEQATQDLLAVRVSDEQQPCPCCVARKRLPGSQAQAVDRIHKHETMVDFDPEAMLTTVKTTIHVAAKWVDWDAFVFSCDPANWKKIATEFFQKSDPIEPVSARTDGKSGWIGRLHEVFDWNWNADSEAMFDNDLNIDFAHGRDDDGNQFAHSEYDLYRSNASKLWTARESGGLDVDGGYTHATLTAEWLVVTATKEIRFTDPELGPPGMGAMLNYLAPTLTGLWMHETVQAGVEKAIRSEPISKAPAKRAAPAPVDRPYSAGPTAQRATSA